MKRIGLQHPKVDLLADFIADCYPGAEPLKKVAAVGMLESLWHHAARYCPRGDVGRYPDSVTVTRMGWKGEGWERKDRLAFSDNFICETLITFGLLDRHGPEDTLVVHDWHEHADDSCKKSLEKRGVETFFTGEPIRSRIIRESFASRSRLPVPVPVPVPVPIKNKSNSNSGTLKKKTRTRKQETDAPESLPAADVQRLGEWVSAQGIKIDKPVGQMVAEMLSWYGSEGIRKRNWFMTAQHWIRKRNGVSTIGTQAANAQPTGRALPSMADLEARWAADLESQKPR